MNRERVLAGLRESEGLRLEAYRDTVGVLTIGYGHTQGVVEGARITKDEAEALLSEDLDVAIQDVAGAFPWALRLPEPAHEALVEMCYQLGLPRLTKFRKMLQALMEERYAWAIVEAMDSRWSRQTPARVLLAARAFALAGDGPQ